MFIKKNPKLTKVSEIVSQNTGLPIEEFLDPDPFPEIYNLHEGVELVKTFKGKTVKILGDYDVDGICSTTILELGLEQFGIETTTRIPYRFSEGYGLSESIIDEIGEPDSLLITVDNGITSLGAIQKAKNMGMTVIVIDHHLPAIENNEKKLPIADVIIDPYVFEKSSYKEYCGAGLAFRFIKELLPDKDLSDLLVVASLATVCDIMNLTGANRWLVKTGLEYINQGKGTEGLRVLVRNEKEEGIITEEDYGFLFGPIINAAGRLEDRGATRALKLIHENRKEMSVRAQLFFRAMKLHTINEERKELVKKALSDIDFSEKNVVAYNPEWCEGIVGLIAGQLCEKTHSPAIVFTQGKNGLLKGSGRSTEQIHLKNVLDEMKPLIEKYGGHSGAAGLSIQEKNLEKFREEFKRLCFIPEEKEDVYYDLELNLLDIAESLDELQCYAPYGKGNPQIRYMVDIKNFNASYIGQDKKHIQMKLDLSNKKTLNMVGFNMSDSYDMLGKPKHVKCIGNLNKSWHNGEETFVFHITNIESGE